MSNSDAFAHVHRVRDSDTRRAFEVARRQLDAYLADLDAMASARRVDVLAPGSGLAGGGRSRDVADPTGNTALRHDRHVEHWARIDLATAELVGACNALTAGRHATLADPTPTGLCRDGACPTGSLATTIIKGVPRCSTCKAFWYAISNPEERYEREYPGQTPGVTRNRCVA
jgi:hypothetical protein